MPNMQPDEKRNNLIGSAGELKVGRREPPEPDDPKEKLRRIAVYVIAASVVVVVVIALIVALGANTGL